MYSGVRTMMLDAHEPGTRSSEHESRQVRRCDACAACRRDVRRPSQPLAALNPAFGLPVAVGALKLVAGASAPGAVGVAGGDRDRVSGGLIVLGSGVFGRVTARRSSSVRSGASPRR